MPFSLFILSFLSFLFFFLARNIGGRSGTARRGGIKKNKLPSFVTKIKGFAVFSFLSWFWARFPGKGENWKRDKGTGRFFCLSMRCLGGRGGFFESLPLFLIVFFLLSVPFFLLAIPFFLHFLWKGERESQEIRGDCRFRRALVVVVCWVVVINNYDGHPVKMEREKKGGREFLIWR